jgi:hypothetical protein
MHTYVYTLVHGSATHSSIQSLHVHITLQILAFVFHGLLHVVLLVFETCSNKSKANSMHSVHATRRSNGNMQKPSTMLVSMTLVRAREQLVNIANPCHSYKQVTTVQYACVCCTHIRTCTIVLDAL